MTEQTPENHPTADISEEVKDVDEASTSSEAETLEEEPVPTTEPAAAVPTTKPTTEPDRKSVV